MFSPNKRLLDYILQNRSLRPRAKKHIIIKKQVLTVAYLGVILIIENQKRKHHVFKRNPL